VGHSMGGGISMAYAATFPEHVDKVVMIDVYGPLPGDVDKTTSVLRSHIETRKRGKRPNRTYPTLEKAVETRRLTATKAPGGQYLSVEAATELVKRATVPASPDGVGYQFRHDTRLLWPSIQYLMPEQVEHMMKAVECPVCLIAAEDGWPFKSGLVETSLQVLDPAIYKTLPGSHHLHADPETAEPVLDVVYDFISGRNMTYVI
jgi:pimeloyl-ACP methyl ester carboxylesterase